MKITISIIVPVFNRVHIIKETLDSIRNQTSSNWECILVDDGSTDGSFKLMQDYIIEFPNSTFKLVKNKRKKGAPGARNTGIDRAKGNYLMFLDSDDILLENCIQARTEMIFRNPGFDYYCFKTNSLLPNGGKREKYNPLKSNDNIKSFLHFENPWHTMGCVLKSEIIDKIGYWDKDFARSQDSEYYLRLVLNKRFKGFMSEGEYDSLFREGYTNDSISSENVVKKEIQDTYHKYLEKVKNELNDLQLWNEYRNDYLYFSFYIYSRFLMPAGILEDRFLKNYLDTLKKLEISDFKFKIYSYYFRNRGAVKNTIFKFFLKLIPKIFTLPYSSKLLW